MAKKSNRILKIAILAIVGAMILLVVSLTSSRLSPLAWGWYGEVNAPNGVALEGYDSVAYHSERRAVAGNPQYQMSWNEVEWRFTSEFNLEQFKHDPNKYAPQFGGNCANAVSKGFTKKADPQVWFIKDDKLYVFNTDKAKQEFLAKIPAGIIEQSQSNWTKRTIQ